MILTISPANKILNQNKSKQIKINLHQDALYKRSEFLVWLMEVKSTNYESLSKWEEEKLMEDYMEDFNTCTMPHEKYYDLDKWEKKEEMLKKKGLVRI
jgi:hypothetical protein